MLQCDSPISEKEESFILSKGCSKFATIILLRGGVLELGLKGIVLTVQEWQYVGCYGVKDP